MRNASFVGCFFAVAVSSLAVGACAQLTRVSNGGIVTPSPTQSDEPKAEAKTADEPGEPMRSMAGTYKFQGGLITIKQTAAHATGTYGANGKIDCTWNGKLYACDWSEGGKSGKGELWWFDEHVIGNWGEGQEAKGGGRWDLWAPDHTFKQVPAGTYDSGGSSGGGSSAKSCNYNSDCDGAGPGTTTRCLKGQCASSIGSACNSNSDCGYVVQGNMCVSGRCVAP